MGVFNRSPAFPITLIDVEILDDWCAHPSTWEVDSTNQARTNLTDTLKYLRNTKEDCVVLVSMPSKLTYSPQPQQGKYYTMLPINGNPIAEWGPIGSFASTTLPIASREGQCGDMAV